jgi:hypothetical protein
MANSPGSLQVENDFVLGRVLDWQVAGAPAALFSVPGMLRATTFI